MTHIQVYKYSKALSRLGIGFGCVLLFFGIFSFTKHWSNGFDTRFPSGDWNSVLNIIQGLLFVSFGAINLFNKKYFIEWNEDELRFKLPDTKQLEVIKCNDIEDVNIGLFEIELQLTDQKRTLDINYLNYEGLKTIKSKFKSILHEKNEHNP